MISLGPTAQGDGGKFHTASVVEEDITGPEGLPESFAGDFTEADQRDMQRLGRNYQLNVSLAQHEPSRLSLTKLPYE